MTNVRHIGALWAMAVIAASCSSTADTTSEPTAGPAVTVTSTSIAVDSPSDAGVDATLETQGSDSTPVEAASGLDGAIGHAADLAISWLNGAAVDEATYDISFDDSFRAAVPFSSFILGLDQLTLDAPFEVQAVQEATDTEASITIVGASGTPALLGISIAGVNDQTMTGLAIGPAELPTFDAPSSVDAAVARLEALGTLRMASMTADCSVDDPVLGANEQAPIGSIFKLWVLAAVVDAVDAGSLTWDDEVEVRDEFDSIPSGFTQNEQPGTLLTVRELATRMIEISDNTATDHLIDLVDRAAVEAAMIESGHADPARNLPLMTTREFTIVKFTSDELRNRYLAANEAERRSILEEVGSLPLPPLANITAVAAPVEVEMLEWFASPTDLCRVLVELAENDEAASILALNPGMPDLDNRWTDILYKGGSEPGVFAMAWLTVNDDGTRSVFAASIANEREFIDEFEAANLLGFVRDAR